MNKVKKCWLDKIGHPDNYDFEHTLTLLQTFDEPDFDGELYLQANGPGTAQRVLFLFPKNLTGPVPGVLVPFYFPEAMVGYDSATGETLENFRSIAMMRDLVCRGYAVASAEAYHLTYLKSDREREDFMRWKEAGDALIADHPAWTGIGKLIADTTMVLDVFAADARVDASRLGIAGHSLGGKMAFYTGCLDDRIRAIMVSDFGIGWDQSNWNESWYWGDKLNDLKSCGMVHSDLLGLAAPKPMFLLAGEYDNAKSWEIMNEAPGYEEYKDRLGICNHATGHRPPAYALEKGYSFLDQWLK